LLPNSLKFWRKLECRWSGEFRPGSGATFGNAIVQHPKTRFIAFTGSKAVGLDIHERAAKTARADLDQADHPGDGRQDSILVCADADVDAAADGWWRRRSDSGQCSPARGHYRGPDLRHLRGAGAERVKQLAVGDPAENKYMGDQIRRPRLMLGYIEAGRKEGQQVAGGTR
jgi:1-pyrroline-5-carboxylate dehydrogenase